MKWVRISGTLQSVDVYLGMMWGTSQFHAISSRQITGYRLVIGYNYTNKNHITSVMTNISSKGGKSKKGHSKKRHTTATYKKTVRGKIVTLKLTGWSGHSGSLKVVSVGPAGIWGVNKKHKIYKW